MAHETTPRTEAVPSTPAQSETAAPVGHAAASTVTPTDEEAPPKVADGVDATPGKAARADPAKDTFDFNAAVPTEEAAVPAQMTPDDILPDDHPSADPTDGASQFSTGLSVDDDVDSTLGDIDSDALTSTQSVRSSIYEFVEENGRTFHKYKQGKYFMPNDEMEQERLDLQHNIFVLLLKGQLARAPVKDPQRVLDIGTGTGIWATEYAYQNPSAEVLGTDLSPIQPQFVPPNCRFEIDDAEDEWAYGNKPFDLVHLRLLWHSFNDPVTVLQSAYDNLKPGGYIEWQDLVSRFRAVDDSLQGSALKRLDQLYYEGGRKLGRDMDVTPKITGMMRQVGFVDVVEERYALPGNPWPKGKDFKTLGYWQMRNFNDGVSAITMTVLTRGLGMSVEEVELLLVDVRKDIKDTNIHYYLPVYVMYGRKPFPHEVPAKT